MDIDGQKTVVTYLTNALRLNRLSPSLLFSGPPGAGKTHAAFETAKALLGRIPHSDFLFVDESYQAALTNTKVEAQKTIKIETVRSVGKFLSFKPMEGDRRVAVLKNAHTLTIEAANALLKILEEPPAFAQLILLAVDPRNLPSTIRSRCAHLPFRPRPVQPEPASPDAAGADYALDEFFDILSHPAFRSDSRAKAEKTLLHFMEKAQRELEAGRPSARKNLEILLAARRQLDRYVPPRLVLENAYLKLEK